MPKGEKRMLAAMAKKNAAKAAKVKPNKRRQCDDTLPPEREEDVELRDFFSEMKKREFWYGYSQLQDLRARAARPGGAAGEGQEHVRRRGDLLRGSLLRAGRRRRAVPQGGRRQPTGFRGAGHESVSAVR